MNIVPQRAPPHHPLRPVVLTNPPTDSPVDYGVPYALGTSRTTSSPDDLRPIWANPRARIFTPAVV